MRWILRALLVVAAIAIAWLGIAWSGVLPPVSAEQRAALAFLRDMPPPPPGRNAFALLWAQPWAVPAGQEEAVLAEDVARFAEWEARWTAYQRAHPDGSGDEAPPVFGSVATERFERRARLPDGKDWLCDGSWDADCLAAVAKDPVAAREALRAAGDVLALAGRLDDTAFVRSPFPPHLATPLPGYAEWNRLALNAAALRAHDGDAAGALDDLCRFGNTWRRLRSGADNLVTDMIGIAYATVAVQQALAIHAAAPAGTPWPPACDALIAPLSTAERDQCPAARGEFALADHFVRDAGAVGAGLGVAGPLLNAEHALARMTANYRALCPSLPGAGDDPACGALEMLFNPAGCRLVALSTPLAASRMSYVERLRDFDRRLALARAARWWREQPGAAAGGSPAWPDAFSDIRDDISLDPAARTLALPMRDTSNPERTVFRVRY